MDENMQQMMQCSVNDALGINTSQMPIGSDATSNLTCWHYWTDYYYPQVIYRDYPVYIQERAKDKGKQAFEIIKILKDKKLVKLEKVS